MHDRLQNLILKQNEAEANGFLDGYLDDVLGGDNDTLLIHLRSQMQGATFSPNSLSQRAVVTLRNALEDRGMTPVQIDKELKRMKLQ